MKLYMFQTVPLSIIRSFSLYTVMEYVIQVCRQLSNMSETCRVSFQIKFEKLEHLVGFIIRICHNARSHEHKKKILHVLTNHVAIFREVKYKGPIH